MANMISNGARSYDRRLQQTVVRVEVIHVFRSDQLVRGEHGGRHRLAGQDLQRQLQQSVPVLLREERDAPDQTGIRAAQLRTRFRLRILTDDHTFARAACLFVRAQCAERARIVYRANQHALGLRFPQMLAHALQRSLELPVAVHADNPAALRHAQHLADSALHAAYTRLRQRSGAVQLHQQNLIGLAVPMLLRPTSQIMSRHQPGLIVVGAEIGRARVRNIDRDERNARLQVFAGDGGRNQFIGLELHYQVHLLFDQVVRAA